MSQEYQSKKFKAIYKETIIKYKHKTIFTNEIII